MGKSILIDIILESPLRFKSILPIIIPNNVKTLDFNIVNLDEFKGCEIYVLQVEKGNLENKKIKVNKGVFSIPLDLIEDKNYNFSVYAVKGNEAQYFDFNKDDLKINKIVNLTNAEKFSSILIDLVNKIVDLEKRVDDLEDMAEQGLLL